MNAQANFYFLLNCVAARLLCAPREAVQIKVAKVLNKILNWRISISDIIPFKIISFARKKDYLSISIDQNDGSKFFFFFDIIL